MRNFTLRKYSILFTFFMILCCGCSSKNYIPKFFPKEKFPQSWFGYWSGDLQIYSPKGIKQTVSMALEIVPTDQTDVFTWAIIYGEGQLQTRRNYEIKTLNVKDGLYVIDEKNSIFIEAYHFNNQLISHFEVNANELISIYEKQGDYLIFNIIMGKSKSVSETGGEEFEGKEIPLVKSYPISTTQRAILKRQ